MKINLLKQFILVVCAAACLSSCITLNPGRMLKTPKDYQFAKFPDSVKIEPYRIAVNDVVRFSLYTNEGFKLASLLGQNSASGNLTGQSSTEFKVRPDGNIKMPVLGEINVIGLTVKETEEMLENKFQHYYVNPFVIVEITNKRIFMFKGGSSSSEISLENENSTLFEVLAKSGGASGGGNNMNTGGAAGTGQNYANKIKIIRGDLKNPTIYLVDLSKIEGLKDADIVMQAGDIVYIDPVINYGSSISQDIGSVTGLVSSVLSIFLIYNLIKK